MPKKIEVIFCVPDYYDDCCSTNIPVTKITPAQLKQCQKAVANARRPADACPYSITVEYTDRMSFTNGGMRSSRLVERRRILQISDLFYSYDKSQQTKCGICMNKIEEKLTAHCARNLRAGKCQDEFMRRTLGATLFPRLYANEKQK